jgi:hypothetical protein
MSEGNQSKAVEKLWMICEEFVKKQHIYCAESIYQSDRVIENAYEFIESVCDVVGYMDCDDEAETAAVDVTDRSR